MPPLGGKLFAELEGWGGQFSSIPAPIKATFFDNFEAGMSEFYSQTSNVMTFHREMSHFLALFRPGPENVYRAMLNELGRTRVIYCSLNYDLLLEQSAAQIGWNTVYRPESRDGFVRCLKLHGSANFWPAVNLRNVQLIGNSFDIVGAPIKYCNRDETLLRCKTEDSVSPVIAMFAEGKAVKVCPSVVEEQQAWWAKEVALARSVFVVGVRVHPVDAHIWGALASTAAPLTYFGLEQDRPEFADWKRNIGKGNAYFQRATFAESVPLMKRKMKS